jgi:hypothetical protein
MNRQELQQWLGDRGTRGLPLSEIADVLHVVVEASRRTVSLADADELRELSFAIAVLRDVFPRDQGLHSWLRSSSDVLGGETPSDLIAAGRIRDFADLAVAEWNRPRVHAIIRTRSIRARV